MNEFHRSFRQLQEERDQSAISARERDYSKRQKRARKHLERMRSEPRPHPPLAILMPCAVGVSLMIGVLFGSPIVATARSWIAGEAVRLETISVRGNQLLGLAEVAQSTRLEPGAQWNEIDAREVEANLIAHPWIADASALQLPTGRLLVRIHEEVPHALVSIGKPAQDYAVNLEGVPFAAAGGRVRAALPRLIPSESVEPDVANARLARAIELVQRMPAFDLPMPSEVIVGDVDDPTGFALRLPNLKARILLGHDHFDERLESLARLLESDLEEVEASETLDLRFADQAVLRGAPPRKRAEQAAAARGRATSSRARPTG